MADALIFDALRTPRGRGKPDGALHGVPPVQLAAQALAALRERNGLAPDAVDDVVLGIVTPVGEQGQVLPRVAALMAGLGERVAGVQVNRFCASGLEACNMAAAKVMAGQADLMVAGGVESMSRVPILSDGGPWGADPEVAFSTYFVPQGVSADLIATKWGYGRDRLDDYAVESHRRAARAWTEGHFARSVVPVTDRHGEVLLERDETVRPNATPEQMAGLKPAFAGLGEAGGFDRIALMRYPDLPAIAHVHHPGNSSGIVDGAAGVLIGSREFGEKWGLKPRARIVQTCKIGTDPTIMLTGPVPATQKILADSGMAISDIDLFEVNEAFASVVLRFQQAFDVDPGLVNVNGGAIAMGHPLGATGAIIIGTLLDELERTGKGTGLATLCIASGMGAATIIERV